MKITVKGVISKIGIILGLLGVIFFALGLFCTESVFDKVLLMICATLLFLVGGSYIYIDNYAIRNIRCNMFLYDYNTKKEKNVEDITFESICRTLDLYIPVYVYSDTGDSWFDNNITRKFKNINSNMFLKLLYYRMLYIWIDEAQEKEYKRLGSLSRIDVDYLVEFMEDMGEYEISSKLKKLSELYDGDDSELRGFFKGKKEYLRNTITDFVKENIEEF